MSSVSDRLDELGIRLPPAPKPVAAYVPAVRSQHDESLIFVSGQIPMDDGSLPLTGTVPSQVGLEQAQEAARQCVINGLAVLRDMLDGDLDRVHRIIRLGVFVASDRGFTDQPAVANGASTLLHEIFGPAGQHARAAVGSVALPLGAPVEVEMLAAVV